jgi:hypothetical protein
VRPSPSVAGGGSIQIGCSAASSGSLRIAEQREPVVVAGPQRRGERSGSHRRAPGRSRIPQNNNKLSIHEQPTHSLHSPTVFTLVAFVTAQSAERAWH